MRFINLLFSRSRKASRPDQAGNYQEAGSRSGEGADSVMQYLAEGRATAVPPPARPSKLAAKPAKHRNKPPASS